MELSKKGLTVTIEIADSPKEDSTVDSRLDKALDSFGKHVEDLGYTDYEFEVIETPYETNRGELLAKGNFRGPSPFEKETRPPEDISDYSFTILHDEKVDSDVVEVKHENAVIATFELTGGKTELIDGDLPHV